MVDPPPILSLDLVDDAMSPAQVKDFLRKNSGVVHCDILEAETGSDAFMVRDRKHTRRLLGTVVSNIIQPSNTSVIPPRIACFPDLSVRTPGKFRLKFRVMFASAHVPGARLPVVASVTSDIFEVYNAKEFPGMQASTPLVMELRNQGFNVPIKKGQQQEDEQRERSVSSPTYTRGH